jgi:hypothetical protein
MIETDRLIAPAAASPIEEQIERALKTAERLLRALQGKPISAGAIARATSAGASDDVRLAPLALGYNDNEPTAAIWKQPDDQPVSKAIWRVLNLQSKV